jgi:hypothetical protein
MPRPQFTLKTLLWLMAVVAAFFAAVRWHNNRLPVLCDKFNALVEQRRYTDADAVAVNMRQLYPNEMLPRCVESLCRLFPNKEPPPYQEPVAEWNPDELARWQKLVDEHRAAKARSPGAQE